MRRRHPCTYLRIPLWPCDPVARRQLPVQHRCRRHERSFGLAKKRRSTCIHSLPRRPRWDQILVSSGKWRKLRGLADLPSVMRVVKLQQPRHPPCWHGRIFLRTAPARRHPGAVLCPVVASQFNRWAIGQLTMNVPVPNLAPPGPVKMPSCTRVRIRNSSVCRPRKPLAIESAVHS